MTMRLRVTAFVFVTCLALAAFLERQGVPVAQIDLYAGNDVSAVLTRMRTEDAVAQAMATLPPVRRQTFVEAPFGVALAAVDPGERAMEAVSLRVIGPDRLRIRVASRDKRAARMVAESVRHEAINAGLEERISLSSASSGGGMALLGWLAAALAGGVLAVQLLLRPRPVWRRSRQLAGKVMRGAGSI